MISFLVALAVLIGGYFIYGLFVERVFGIEPDRPTPAITHNDGVDFVPMPGWKIFLVQFLNIAGLGPIFGAIMGIMYGPAAYLWIVLGTIFAGAVHDFVSGMISLRAGGISLPEIVGQELGSGVKQVMRVFSIVLLILVGGVFVVTTSGLIASLTPEALDATFWAAVIFVYYLLATLFPVDKLIGNIYPLFAVVLFFMAVGLVAVMVFGDVEVPEAFAGGLGNRYAADLVATHPIMPMLFISIACGAISGFHATQSPMMARCMTNERQARPIFYGAMVAEGVVALIWSAATITFTGGYEGLSAYMADPAHGPGSLIHEISQSWFGVVGGIVAMIGVIAAPITTGDTALRSAPHRGRLRPFRPAPFLAACACGASAVCAHFPSSADRFQRAVALFRLEQSDSCRVHSVGMHGLSGTPRQDVHHNFYSGNVHDGGLHCLSARGPVTRRVRS